MRDVDAATKVALQNAAKVLFEPHSIPDRGREAVFSDPQGAVFAVLDSSSGDTSDALATPGDWIWSLLITSDPDTAGGGHASSRAYRSAPASHSAPSIPSQPRAGGSHAGGSRSGGVQSC